MFPFRRLNIGERLTQFPAGSWNAIIDFIEKSSGQQPQPPRNSPPPPVPPMQLPVQSGAPASGGGIIQIQNKSGNIAPMYGVMRVRWPLTDPKDDPTAPYRQEPVEGFYAYALDDFCIVQPPSDLAPEYVGPAVISGLTWAKVKYRDKAHSYCHPIDTGASFSVDNLTYLESDHTGYGRLVWLEHGESEDPTNNGYPQWALINLGAGGEPEFALGEVDESHNTDTYGPDQVRVKFTRLFTTARESVGDVVTAHNAFQLNFTVGDKVLVHSDTRYGAEHEEGGSSIAKYFAFGSGSSAQIVPFRLREHISGPMFAHADIVDHHGFPQEEILLTQNFLNFASFGPRPADEYNDEQPGGYGYAAKIDGQYWVLAVQQPVLFAVVELEQDADAYEDDFANWISARLITEYPNFGGAWYTQRIKIEGPDDFLMVADDSRLARNMHAKAGDKWLIAHDSMRLGRYILVMPAGGSGYAIVKGTAQHTVQRTNTSVVLENLQVVQGPLPPHQQITAAIPADAKLDCPSGTELYAFYDESAGETDQTRWCAAHKHNHYWIMRGHEGFDQFSSNYERQVLTNQGGTEPEMKWAESEWGGYTADVAVVTDVSWDPETCQITVTKKQLSFTEGRLTGIIDLP